MKRIGIIDPDGFLGQHFRWYLTPFTGEVEVILLPALTPGSIELSTALQGCEVVVHMASITPRDIQDEGELSTANVAQAKTLTDACDVAGISPHIVFASSTHINRDTAYGKAKKQVDAYLRAWAQTHSTSVATLVIPNEFGEGGAVFNGSVVATFCHQLAKGEPSEVTEGASLSLIYAQDIACALYEACMAPINEIKELYGEAMSVMELYALLRTYYEEYVGGAVPRLDGSLHASLFATLRFHLWENGFYPRVLTPRSDERGALFEVVQGGMGGVTFVSSTKPAKTRGDHYHMRKLERFCVVQGQATIRLRNVLTDKTISYDVSGDAPCYIDMPRFVTHNVTNTGTEDALIAFWCDEVYDSADPDTYPLAV